MRNATIALIALLTLGFFEILHYQTTRNSRVEVHACDHGDVEVTVDRYTTKQDLERACIVDEMLR